MRGHTSAVAQTRPAQQQWAAPLGKGASLQQLDSRAVAGLLKRVTLAFCASVAGHAAAV